MNRTYGGVRGRRGNPAPYSIPRFIHLLRGKPLIDDLPGDHHPATHLPLPTTIPEENGLTCSFYQDFLMFLHHEKLATV